VESRQSFTSRLFREMLGGERDKEQQLDPYDDREAHYACSTLPIHGGLGHNTRLTPSCVLSPEMICTSPAPCLCNSLTRPLQIQCVEDLEHAH
jgi:hypothetical protein